MSHVDTTIARIPGMTAKSRAALRQNAENMLAKSQQDAAAQRIIEALDDFEGDRAKTSDREVTGLLSWEKHRSGQATFRGFFGDEEVGRIFKRADHSMADKDVYSVEIMGEAVAGSFQHIRDAREAGEQAFAAREQSRA